jgi:hypothetical protein
MVHFLRPAEVFRHKTTLPWALAVLLLAAVAVAVSSALDPTIGLVISLALMLYLLAVIVDFLSDAEVNATDKEQNLAERVSGEVVSETDRLLTNLAAKLGPPARGILAMYDDPIEVPFTSLLDRTTTLPLEQRQFALLSWYFTHLVTGGNLKALRRFLQSGGRMVIVVPEVTDMQLSARLAAMRSAPGDDLSARDIMRQTYRSVRALHDLRVKLDLPADVLTVIPRVAPINFHAYDFGGRDLVIGVYENTFDPAARAPRLHVDLAASRSFADFWAGEWRRLTADGSKVDLESWLHAVDEATTAAERA